MQAGKLSKRIEFQKRSLADDGLGNTVGDFTPQFTVWGNVKYLRGGESVMAARLTAKQPAILTVRKSADTDIIAPEWRAKINGNYFNIREHPTPTDNRLYLQFLAEGGVASG